MSSSSSSSSSNDDDERIIYTPICDKSFPYGDDEAIMQANESDGYCVVRDILYCLFDRHTATSGCFASVPGFQREFEAWGQVHPLGSVVVNGNVLNDNYGTGQPHPVPLDDPCQDRVVRVVAPTGSAVLWDSRLPHQNLPNADGKAFRVAHYTMRQIRDDETVQYVQNCTTRPRNGKAARIAGGSLARIWCTRRRQFA